MTKRVALLFGAMVAIAVSSGPVVAQGNQTDRGFSLPVGVTGPATSSLDRLHTVPRIPASGGDNTGGLASGSQAASPVARQDGIVAVSH
jgi:hypothetical protein